MKLSAFTLSLSLLVSGSLQASTSLVTIYEQALQSDPQLQSSIAAANANKQTMPQARAGLLPQINGFASFTESTSEGKQSFGGGTANDLPGTSNQTTAFGANLRQPLFNLNRWFSYQAAKGTSAAAESDLAIAQQELILRTAEAYFQVLRATDNLSSSSAEEAAVKRQLEQTEQRFKVGLIAITNVHEARAAYDLSRVQRIVDEGTLDVRFEALEQLTGKVYNNISALKADFPILAPQPTDRAEWELQAQQHNLQVKKARLQALSANNTLKAKRSDHAPTLDFVASYNDSDDDFGSEIQTTQFGIELSVPLFAGGATSAVAKQAYYQREQTQQSLAFTERQARQDIRILHRTNNTDVLKVNAQKQAILSNESALEATQTGYEVGTRNVVEVLQAQQALFRSQRDFANARYDYVLNNLKLKQAAGTLSSEDVYALDQWLDKS